MNPLFDPSLFHRGVIVFIGAPLSGKGTQSALLASALGIPSVSSGDVYRAEVASGSDLGKELDSYMSVGALVPNRLVLDVFLSYLSQPIFQNGVILDGFVREMDNLETLQDICVEINFHVIAFVHLQEESFEVLESRLLGRIADMEARGIPKRKDDDPIILKRRYSTFVDQTLPVIEYLRSSASKYHLISMDPLCVSSSEKPIAEMQNLIQKELVSCILRKHFVTKQSLHKLADLLKLRLATKSDWDDTSISTLLHEFLKLSLDINAVHRSGLSRRFIFLVTTNDHKFQEFVHTFAVYGIEVLWLPPELSPEYYVHFFRLLQPPAIKKLLSLVGIFKETTQLVRYHALRTEDPSLYVPVEIEDGIKVVHLSELTIFEYDKIGDTIQRRSFLQKTPGYLDFRRRAHLNASSVFGWDDIFVVETNRFTFHELKQLGLKISSRDMNLSAWIQDKIYYKGLTDLKFRPVKASRAIDFSIDVYDFLTVHPHYTNTLARQCGLFNVFINVINTGIYFRSPFNRRLKNYWCPGLNSGLPLVPKSDDIHEATFMAHDFGHFGLPDLISTGRTSALHRLVYITWRMLSEAVTMTLADMAFVDTLVHSDITYDYRKRAIYPLFQDLRIDLPLSPPVSTDASAEDADKKEQTRQELYRSNLKRVIYANYRYCLLGDDSEYKSMLAAAGSSEDNLQNFKDKYSAFFMEDFRWTVANYENTCRHADYLRPWWQMIQPLLSPKTPDNTAAKDDERPMLLTIDDIIERLQLRGIWLDDDTDNQGHIAGSKDQHRARTQAIMDTVFHHVVDAFVLPLLRPAAIHSKGCRLDRAFRRYLIGQCAIFSKFSFLPEAQEHFQDILRRVDVGSVDGEMNLDTVQGVRNVYESFLQVLVNKHLISRDDLATYRESFPLFDPQYLSYDSDHSTQSLADVAQDVLFTPPVFSRELFQEQQQSSRVDPYFSRLLPNDQASIIRPTTLSVPREDMAQNTTATEIGFLHSMRLLLEHCGADVLDEVCVVSPGVLLLSELTMDDDAQTTKNTVEHPDALITFLICGITIECALELVAHKEAAVARLTSSKTVAMHLPFYRLFAEWHGEEIDQTHPSHSLRNQRSLLQAVQEVRRAHFAALSHQDRGGPEKSTKQEQALHTLHGLELTNLSNLATKCTAMCYSMSLQDLHQLFIGRSGEAGNESEMRDVAHRMHQLVSTRYPHIIQPREFYLQASNLAKCTTPLPVTTMSMDAQAEQTQRNAFVPPQFTANMQTGLTPEAKRLFRALHIDHRLPAALQLADFRARITYLAFRAQPAASLQESVRYLRKVACDLGHMSILAAAQFTLPAGAVPHGISSSSVASPQNPWRLMTTKEALKTWVQQQQVQPLVRIEWQTVLETVFGSGFLP